VSRFAFDRAGLPAIALTTDTSILTAIATITVTNSSLPGRCRHMVTRAMF